jgi:hypothetical protein
MMFFEPEGVQSTAFLRGYGRIVYRDGGIPLFLLLETSTVGMKQNVEEL